MAAADRARRLQVMALLLVLTVIVTALASVGTYAAASAPWYFTALGGADSVDLLGPTLLLGALGITVVASGSSSSGVRSWTCLLGVVGGVLVGVLWLVTAYVIVLPPTSGPFTLAFEGWSAARSGTVVEAISEAVVALAAAAAFAIARRSPPRSDPRFPSWSPA